MKNLIEHIKKRIHDLEVEMNDHSEDIGEHTIYFAKMQGASVELLKLMQWIYGQELEKGKANEKTKSEVRRFADWYKDSYGIELPERALQEYERYGAVSGWVAVTDRLPKPLQTVWLTNGKGWCCLGCLIEDAQGWHWAESNGVIYTENGEIVSECQSEDLDVNFWQELPKIPCK